MRSIAGLPDRRREGTVPTTQGQRLEDIKKRADDALGKLKTQVTVMKDYSLPIQRRHAG